MSSADVERLRAIKTFPSLVKYLRDELDWPIETDDVEELTFEYDPEELGIDLKTAAKIQEIKQLRPLSRNQPWGIFFVKFEPKRLPVVVLRRILSQLVVKKRASISKAKQAVWHLHDLLFISNFGEGSDRQITFAHFTESAEGNDLPALRVLGWDDQETQLHMEYAARTLRQNFHWPGNEANADAWRDSWSAAFAYRHREAINTAKDLADRLAILAMRIRSRVNQAMVVETEKGPIRKLYKGFQQALIHDLTEADFADMYAQTITYGLLAARVSRPMGIIADNLHELIPVTNPFLKEMLESFMKVGGRAKGGLDFDELGVQEVVAVLNDPETHIEAVLREFNNKDRQEDPVIHFYEDFLSAYDKAQKKQRGVFYTPQPVVSYIVRSVDELLRTEFGLEDGLASTTTWAEMAQRNKFLKIPGGTDPKSAFVQILDPATGTGTFLVEVIESIFQTLRAKWKQQQLSEAQQIIAWNEYVPRHLLPRMHGYELMMAPYAIAHLKIGLKLYETGYRFGSSERARIYLTNSLEPASDSGLTRLEGILPALAHEAAAVNTIKQESRFTVIVGNPPYSLLSANMETHHRALIENYKFVNGERIHERGALQLEKNLNDDYVKFIRFVQLTVERSGVGASGLITNHSFLDNPTMRGVRWSLINSASRIWINDLHGNSTKQEEPPEGGENENVFQIKQGVAISLSIRFHHSVKSCEVKHCERWGSRQDKEAWLAANQVGTTKWRLLEPTPDHYLFIPQSSSLKAEFESWRTLTEVMPTNGAGYITARDNLVIDFDREVLIERVKAFNSSTLSDASLLEEFDVADKKGWDVRRARAELKRVDISKSVIKTNYRPFDSRWIFFDSTLVWGRSWPTMQHVIRHPRNLTLLATRMTKDQWDVWVACTVSSHKAMSAYDTNSVFPLRLDGESENPLGILEEGRRINFSDSFLKSLSTILGLKQQGPTSIPSDLTAEDIFHYAYAVFRSPGYRIRYAEFLKLDFPRLPLTPSLKLFRELARLGSELVSLHLLESPTLEQTTTEAIGSRNQVVEKVSWLKNTVWVDKGQTTGFKGISEAVWNFHVGGYQVCEKWLKDRKGHTLSKDEKAHYQRIVVAISESIRLMTEIDKVIDAHGGWPSAFQGNS